MPRPPIVFADPTAEGVRYRTAHFRRRNSSLLLSDKESRKSSNLAQRTDAWVLISGWFVLNHILRRCNKARPAPVQSCARRLTTIISHNHVPRFFITWPCTAALVVSLRHQTHNILFSTVHALSLHFLSIWCHRWCHYYVEFITWLYLHLLYTNCNTQNALK